MKLRRTVVRFYAILQLVVILGAMFAGATSAQTFNQDDYKRGDLTGAMNLLNMAGERDAVVLELYTAAFNVLEASPDASYEDVVSDSNFQRIVRDNNIVHLGGPMLGVVGPTSVNVWVRTAAIAEVEVRLSINGEEQTFGPVSTTFETDLAAIVEVTGLEPGVRYPYEVLVDGQAIEIPEHATISTIPTEASLRDADGETDPFRIAFGSCFHRWGLTNQKQADMILSREPSAMLMYGDIAVQDRNNHLGLHRADYLLRDTHIAWRDLTASTPVYTTWDDHDYFDNDKAGIPRGYVEADKQGVCDTFQKSWNNPSYGLGLPDRGVFFRTRIGPCDVIMLDDRYFRSGEKGSFLGPQQLDWLEAQLLDCEGPFIIMSCGTMFSDYVSNGKDSWGVWDPEGRERIFSLIEENQIPGVLLISGDRHGARGFRIPRPSGHTYYEFEAGSLGGRSGPPARSSAWEDVQLYGISGQYAFGEFTFDVSKPDPECVFRLIHEEGHVIHEERMTRSQLTPPGE
jgi:alkaline phosphatase D